ncbi:hypothetical protein FJZ31_07525 [Candidatus Poribacteria bacterium]|nr:hypothetical protein [Candidatus Poribacteria bacterium]
MLNKLLVFSFAVIILQTAIILPYTYSQTSNNVIETEFYLLCKEVLLGLLSDINGQRILKGEAPQPDDPMDMGLSFTWWESSAIFQQSRTIDGGWWNQLNPKWDNMTYGQKYIEITVLPSLEGLQKLRSLDDISEIVSMEPRIEDIDVTKLPAKFPLPNLTWTPETTWERIIRGYDGKRLSDLGMWRHLKKEQWWRDALLSAAALGAGLILSGWDETIDAVTTKEFAEWPPKAPECWTACAEGEPIYNRPPLPQTKITIEQWDKQSLSRWYLTPKITEVIISPERTSWTAYGRYIAFAVSLDFAARALQKALWQKEQFPE